LVAALLCAASSAIAAEQSGRPADSDRAAIALEALSRLKNVDLETNPAIKAAVFKVLEQVRGTPQFVEIVRDFKITGQDEALLDFAVDSAGTSAGAEAIHLVLEHEKFDLLRTSLAGTNAVKVTEALGGAGGKEIVPLLEPIVTDKSRELGLRKQVVHALAKVPEGAAALVRLASEQKLPDDLKLTASSELNSVRWPDLKAQAAQLLPLPQALNSQSLPPISELIKRKGDSAKGAEVFRRETVACIKCHQVRGEGIDFGPDLSEIGTKLGKDAIYESILDPSVGISFGYEAWQLELKNGDEPYGFIASETADELAIKAVGGIVTRYKKSDIVRRQKQKLSIMPAGLQQTMTVQELVDLVEYLAGLKKE